MWTSGWRRDAFSKLSEEWDVVVVGGGITGAAVLYEAARRGLRAVLVEQRDFAWGSSSRSSKMIHGGLRYLKDGNVGLVRACVHERDRLLREEPALVNRLPFLIPGRSNDRAGRWMYATGLLLYDTIAGRRTHRKISSSELLSLAPHVNPAALKGGFSYADAQTDDARLVLRLVRRAVALGAVALNHTAAVELLRVDGRVCGVAVQDAVTGATAEVRAKVVVNASGAWADRLRAQVGAEGRMRPLRGSHLVFPAWRLPVAQTIAFPHPRDRRIVFATPWEGVTLFGTTDVDHDQPLEGEPRIGEAEAEYLLEAARAEFPALELDASHVTATFAGVRPVVGSGVADPSKESRDHVMWQEDGLLTVTGGKLTTFRLVADGALTAAAAQLGLRGRPEARGAAKAALARAAAERAQAEPLELENPALELRLRGRLDEEALEAVRAAKEGELELIAQTPTTWAELRWAARSEGVVHLDDLLLRRTRLGLLMPAGGAAILSRVRDICQAELGWDDLQWQREAAAYLATWRQSYAPPDPPAAEPVVGEPGRVRPARG